MYLASLIIMPNLLANYFRINERLKIVNRSFKVAKAQLARIQAEQEALESDLKRICESLTTEPNPTENSTVEQPFVIKIYNPSIRETILAFPQDGSDTGLAELREKFGFLSDGAINTRLQKAKKAGLMEMVSWGRYKLTEEGERLSNKLNGTKLETQENIVELPPEKDDSPP